jgi:hypothetical protein
MNTQKKLIVALDAAADAYRDAAREEMESGNGSPWEVYHFMRNSITLEGKARTARRRYNTCSRN